MTDRSARCNLFQPSLRALAALIFGLSAAQMAAAESEALPTDRIIVKYKDNVTAARANASAAERAQLHRQAQDAALRVGQRLDLVRVGSNDTHVMRLQGKLAYKDVAQLAHDIMANDPSVEYAEPDTIKQAQFVPNDVRGPQQWHYYEAAGGINAPAAWDTSQGIGVVVAVVDTGYRPHADLAANVFGGYDFVAALSVANDGNGRDTSALDPGDWLLANECGLSNPIADMPSSWHGTHVAGTIAAVTNNGIGVAGVAYGARILPVRALGKCGGYISDISDGVVWASGGTISGVSVNSLPAQVINLSLGGFGACETTMQNAINSARNSGAVVVVSAGNVPTDVSNFSPANCNNVVTVAATDRNGARTPYSAFGSKVALSAPGGDMSGSAANGILSTFNTGYTTPGSDAYTYYQGTSMAAPHVAGVAALMLSKNPALTVADIEAKLKSSARPFPVSCTGCGSGIVNAAAAVTAAGGGPARNEPAEKTNDTRAAAPFLTSGPTFYVYGTMANSTDTDYFGLVANPGKSFTVRLTPNSTSNYDLYVYNSAGTEVARSTHGAGLVDSVTYTNPANSTSTAFYARVRYVSGGTGIRNGLYTLKLY